MRVRVVVGKDDRPSAEARCRFPTPWRRVADAVIFMAC
jgi:hypothetical protein